MRWTTSRNVALEELPIALAGLAAALTAALAAARQTGAMLAGSALAVTTNCLYLVMPEGS